MKQVTKGLRCHCCGHEQNYSVAESLLELACPKCGVWVKLGQALGLSLGDAVITVAVLFLIFG